MKDIHDWLAERVGEDWLGLGTGDPTEFGMLAGVLRAEAEAVGYGAQQLESVCSGDISDYLMKHMSPDAFTSLH